MAGSTASGSSLELLFADLLKQQTESSAKPPVHLWNPEKSGDMDMRIDREGRWIHEGGEIKRQALVRLFSSIIKREGDSYFLVTPVEKWQIMVDIAPFFIVAAKLEVRGSEQAVVLTSSTGEQVVVSKKNPLWVDYDQKDQQPIPLVNLRDNLNALIGRSAYYQLIDWGHLVSGVSGEDLFLHSMGEQFLLGQIGTN
jgi:hypothetical protein